ncbi:MAG: amidohydrolase, partial [Gemmatimonadaceae bacterium]
MMRNAAAGFALAAVTALSLPAQAAQTRARPIAITGVTVTDVTRGLHRRGMTVVVADGRIAAVGRVSQIRVPAGARVVDGAGQFLMPGLWDMHAHVDDHGLWAFPLYVAYGVTG